MKRITREMIKIYGTKDKCWMGYKLVRTNKGLNATFHHLEKRECGGKETIDNGAILSDIAHNYLNIIECKDKPIYDAINGILMVVNKQGYAPTREQYRIINCLLEMFEEKHKDDVNSRGKKLIKHKYLERETRGLK